MRFFLNLKLELMFHLSHHLVMSICFVSLVQPRIIQKLMNRASSFWIFNQHFFDKLHKLRTIRVIFREGYFLFYYVSACFIDCTLASLRHKRMTKVCITVYGGSQRPYICGSTFDWELLFYYLWGMEHDCSFDVFERILVDLGYHSKVTHFCIVVLVKKNILWFDVSMHQLIHENRLKTFEAVPGYFPDLFFREYISWFSKFE